MSRGAADNGLLIGRADALQALQRRLDALIRGCGSLALISGEAGIGKTTLALASGERARALGAASAVGRCYERGVAPPFAPWHDLLAELQAGGALDLAPLPPPFGCGPQAQTTYQLMLAVVTLLQRAAAARPLALLLDDLHWSDQETLDLLDVATRNLQGMPLLMVVTYRSEALHPDRPLYDALPGLQRDRPVETIGLGELNIDETAFLVESRYGRCSPQLAAYLHARSDGHPLFLVELLRDLAERRMLTLDESGQLLPPARSLAVPTILQHLIAQRIGRLGSDAEALLETAAVVGEQWELAVVEAVLGWPEEQLLHLLEGALAAHIILPVAGEVERYQFTHGFIREVLYGRQIGRRRKQLHARVGAILEQSIRSDRPPTEHTAALAYHFGAAERWNKAAEYSMAAGDGARDRFASHSALLFYQQAFDLAARDGSALAPVLLLQLHEKLGHAHMVLNQREPAEAAFTEMLEAARAQGDHLAEGRALCHLTYILAWLHRYAEGRAIGEAALRVAEEMGDQELLALSHAHLGSLHVYAGDLELARRHLEQAEYVARMNGASGALSRYARMQSYLALWGGQYKRAEMMAAEALALGRAGHNAIDIGGACFAIGLALGEMGRYEEARQALQAGLDHTAESGERRYAVRLLNTMGWLHCELGDVEEALRWDRRALEGARIAQDDQLIEMERYSLLNVATDELRAGRLEAAQALVREFEPMLDRDDALRFRYLNRYQLLRAELAVACGAFDSAISWAEEAAEFATSKGMPKNQVRSWLLHGRALLGLGRGEEAALLLRRAVALADAIGHAALRWQGRLWLGQAYTGLRQPAPQLYQEALEIVDAIAGSLRDAQLRARFLAAPLVLELRAAAAAAEPGEPPAAAAEYPAGLSAREIEVLRLVAQGATNRAIAEALHISVKTVNAHVTSILGKTGCANRAAAAAFALRHGVT